MIADAFTVLIHYGIYLLPGLILFGLWFGLTPKTMPGVRIVPFGDAEAVERQLEFCDKVGIGVAAVMFEPIQGESGAIVPPDDFWPCVRELTKKYGVLLIADEVVTGFGRAGALFGTRLWNVTADLWCLAKGVSSGSSSVPWLAT